VAGGVSRFADRAPNHIVVRCGDTEKPLRQMLVPVLL
jgi:hypothetical protein